VNLIRTQKLKQESYRIPEYIITYMDNLIHLGIYPTKSDIVRHALIHFLDTDHKMLPTIEKDEEQTNGSQ